MSLLRSRTVVHRARFRAVVRLFTTAALVLTLFVLLLAIAYLWQQA